MDIHEDDRREKQKQALMKKRVFVREAHMRTMSVFVVETYVVKGEKRAEFEPALKEFVEFKDGDPELFSGLISWRLYKQEFGAIGGMYIEMWEFENLEEMDRINTRIFNDKGMKKIQNGFHLLIDPATFSANIWVPVA
jgi:hypothetical protein